MIPHFLIQLQFLFSIFATMMILLGCGGLFLLLQPTLRFSSVGLMGAMGILLVGSLSILVNFFAPLNAYFFSFLCALSLVGWSYLSKRITKSELFWLFVVGIVYWIAGVRAPPMSDVPMYHIPVIHWMHESTLPFGLANLHMRFGFWNFWFSLCGGISAGSILPSGYFTLNVVLVIFAFSDFLGFALGKKDSQNAAFCLAIFILISLVDFHSFSRGQKSPNADFAGEILALWATSYLFLRSETDENWKMPVVLLSGISILVKLNQAHWGIAILMVLGMSVRSKVERKPLLVITGAVIVAGILMVIKSFWTTGCLVFPAKSSCLPVSWRVGDWVIKDVMYWIIRWARNPLDAAAGEFNSWGWVKGWSSAHFGIKIVWSTLMLMGGWMILKCAIRKKLKAPDGWVIGISLLGLVYWFLSAPDIRFGYGGFAILFCAFLGSFIQLFRVPRKMVLGIVALSLLISCMGQVRRADDLGSGSLMVKKPNLESKLNGQRQTIYLPPINEGECWEGTLPCTIVFDYGVVMSHRGRWTFFQKTL